MGTVFGFAWDRALGLLTRRDVKPRCQTASSRSLAFNSWWLTVVKAGDAWPTPGRPLGGPGLAWGGTAEVASRTNPKHPGDLVLANV